MARWAQGYYDIQNPDKYVGSGKPRYRSGWELSFMRFCDSNDAVLQWASEAVTQGVKSIQGAIPGAIRSIPGRSSGMYFPSPQSPSNNTTGR